MSKWSIDSYNGFPVYETTMEDIDLAERVFVKKFSKSNSLNSSTVYARKESRIAGILGEIVFGHYLEHSYRFVGDGNIPYDFIFNGKNIDVKCKFRRVPPRRDFEASFFAYQGSAFFSQVDYYAFLSTMPGYDVFWFCGFVNKKDWINNPKGRLWQAGETDPSNNKTFDKDTWSVFYKDIKQFSADPFDCFV